LTLSFEIAIIGAQLKERKEKMSNTLHYNINSKFGQIEKLKKSTPYGLSIFYRDVLVLLHATGSNYGLNITQTIALYNSYSEDHNYEEINTPFSFRFKNIPDYIIRFFDTSTVRRKLTHSEIFKLILNQSEDAQTALEKLIRIKLKIDREFLGNGVQIIESPKQETKKQKKPKKETKSKKPSENITEVKKKKEPKKTTDMKVKKTKPINLNELNIDETADKVELLQKKSEELKEVASKMSKKIKTNSEMKNFF